jgi:hypothetical protein
MGTAVGHGHANAASQQEGGVRRVDVHIVDADIRRSPLRVPLFGRVIGPWDLDLDSSIAATTNADARNAVVDLEGVSDAAMNTRVTETASVTRVPGVRALAS